MSDEPICSHGITKTNPKAFPLRLGDRNFTVSVYLGPQTISTEQFGLLPLKLVQS